MPSSSDTSVYPQTPDISDVVSTSETPQNDGARYFQRLRGTLTAPTTGDYRFWIASDNKSELWLSTSESKFEKRRIARVRGLTGYQQWDRLPAQDSVLIPLEAGQSYFIEILHKESGGNDHLSVAWQVPGGVREVIPTTALSTYVPDPLDADDDDLPDAWELQFGLDPADNGSIDPNQGRNGDPDGDRIGNLDEFLAGGDPTVDGMRQGHLRYEQWDEVNGGIAGLLNSSKFLRPPGRVEEIEGPRIPSNDENSYGSRMRGYIKPAVTGDYRFAVSGDNQVELWISTDARKFGRYRIADTPFRTGVDQWDKYESQTSEPITLQADTLYYIELLHWEHAGGDHASIGWTVPGGTMEPIPSQYLYSFSMDPDDQDDDDLPDSWEIANNLDPTDNGRIDPINGARGDADGDGIHNLAECIANTDPRVLQGEPGKVLREVWTGISGPFVRQLTQHPSFVQPPYLVELMDGLKPPTNWGDRYGQRLRGTITPTVTGNYRFQLASDNASELWLSTTSDKFSRQRVASVERFTGSSQWNKYPEQTSADIFLIAGQSYYLEILHKEFVVGDHLTARWSLEGGDFSPVPAAVLRSYVPHPNDVDDDGLPDDWEIANGMDATDNGSTDPGNGAYGDFDGDGLDNLSEYVAGTNPAVAGLNPGALTRDVWTGVSGRGVKTLTSQPEFPTSPSERSEVTNFDLPTATNSGTRYHGYLTVPETGNYRFWISADKSAELWISEDESPFHRVKRAESTRVVSAGDLDSNSNQKSDLLYLETGQSYYFELIHKQATGAGHLSVAWTTPGQSREPIDFAHFISATVVAADQDGDLLADAWETTHNFPEFGAAGWGSEHSPYADPDGDLLPNYFEARFGLDPWASSRADGHLTREYWGGMSPNSIEVALIQRDELYGAADKVEFQASSTTGGSNIPGFRRVRGYLVAPETGNYRFWVSATVAGELWLSPSEAKYAKRLLARLSPEDGHGNGIRINRPFKWDTFSRQMSEEVPLVAGQVYYLEGLQAQRPEQDAHLSMAWARPGADREEIPAEFFKTYAPTADDGDDDYLPDAWETQYGLDLNDNGLMDRAHEGERGDFDEDGLSNREEYLLGTDPSKRDTDDDGLSDFEEINTYGTSPTVSDVTTENLVANVPVNSVAGLGSEWTQTGGGVLQMSFRGSGSWGFDVPSDGYYILQVEARLRGDLRFDEILPVHLGIDGREIQRAKVDFSGGQPGSLRVLSPYLKAGMHELSLFFDNYTARRSVEVTRIQVIEPGGLDASGNGIPDWVDGELVARSHLFAHPVYSHVSPAFVEGRSPSPSLVDLTAITRSGEVNRRQRYNDQQWGWMLPGFQSRLSSYQPNLQQQMRAGHGRMEGYQVAHQPGPGYTKWFSRVPLARNEAIGYVAQFEDLGIAENRILVWQPYNVIDGGTLTIPVGSDLLLGAWVQDWDWQTVTLTIGSQTYSFPAAETHVESFSQPGTYQISASHPGGQTGTLTVHVRSADLAPDIALGEDRLRSLHLPGVDPDLVLDAGGEIQTQALAPSSGGGSETTLGGLFPGVHRLAARLSETAPLLDQETVNVVGVSEGLRNSSDLLTPAGDGLMLVRSPLLVTHLPDDGAYIEIDIFAGGVTFPDGTTERTLDNSDLDENGVIMLEFLMPVERVGAPCHYVYVYDKDDVRIWRSNQ